MRLTNSGCHGHEREERQMVGEVTGSLRENTREHGRVVTGAEVTGCSEFRGWLATWEGEIFLISNKPFH